LVLPRTPVRARRASDMGGRLCDPTPRRVTRGVLPAVATSSAMRPNDTARITHQLGRPRATRACRPSVASGLPPSTGTRYACVMPSALGAQAHKRR
jgi:hypothetical protein